MTQPSKLFKLIPPAKRAQWGHCDGWPYILEQMSELFDDTSPVMMDDFVEQTLFNESRYRAGHDRERPQDWFGFCHLPADAPEWYPFAESFGKRLQARGGRHRWDMISGTCRCLFVFNREQLAGIEPYVDCPVRLIAHPTRADVLKWRPHRFKHRVVQTGWFLRDTMSIYELPVPDGYEKIRLHGKMYPWQKQAHMACKSQRSIDDLRELDAMAITERQWQKNHDYNLLLETSVIFAHYLSAAASNTVLECIARHTPILLNRLPALEEYLGRDYPLFYDNFEHACSLLNDQDIIAAHRYLAELGAPAFSVPHFKESLVEILRLHIPEIQTRLDLGD